jgi:RimJ/RimL family protein N-acetyltransferase
MPVTFLEACLRGDKDRAEALIGLHIPTEWFAAGDLIEARLAEFREDPEYAMWGLRAIALEESRAMIGHLGFHSLPNPDYLLPYWPNAIELAYSVYSRYRGMGHAYEAVSGLVQWAAARASVHRFLVCIAASNLPSRRLAEKLGFVKTEEYFDDESDGTHFVYVLHRKALTRLERQHGQNMTSCFPSALGRPGC